jgi:DNA polymerase-1
VRSCRHISGAEIPRLTSLTVAMRRARKDPIARLIAAANAAGVRFRIAGATLQVGGADSLRPDDRALLRRYLTDIRSRLEPPVPELDLLEELDVEVEVITDAGRAREAIAAIGPGALGFDIETMPVAANGTGRPWIRVTTDGRRAVHQPADNDDAGLDPFRARPRLAQIYDPATRTVLVIDLLHVPIDVLKALEGRRLIIHNSAFELAMLGAQGVRLRNTYCTLLMARLALGAERGGLKLAEVAAEFLDGLELPKDEQVSDWSAERLSEHQIAYAALDAVVAHMLARPLWDELDEGARLAFTIGNATIPAVTSMRLAGIPFDRQIHEATIAGWERSYVEARDAFVAITGGDIPPAGAQRSAWLEARMPPDMLARWPRTDTGLLRTRSADLERLAAIPEIRPLLDVIHWDKRLRAFGHTLLEKVGADGRLHMDLKPAWTKTGRCACRNPNTQQLTPDVREAVVAPAGRTLVIADYNQIELRVAAELSGDEAMRQVFRDGGDMHTLNAEDFIGASLETLPADERETARSKAKRIGFGTLYGSGPGGLAASAWSMYRIEMTEAEAQTWKDRFYARYPRLRAWQNATANAAQVTGELRSVAGRPLRAAWEPVQPLKWTLCCNYPVQSSAADVMLIAMAKAASMLEGIDAAIILQVHDELVVEAAEQDAPTARDQLVEAMTEAFLEVFPDAPTIGLVDAGIRQCWAEEGK